MLDNILDPPSKANSNIPTWQTITLPHASFPEDVFTLSQIKISDDHVLILAEENDPEYNPEKTPPVPGVSILLQIPRIKQFFLLNLNTFHVERVKSEVDLSNTFARGMGPYRLFLDGKRSFLCLEGGEKLTLWRLNLSEDYKTIVSMEQKCKENLSLRPIGKVVLYKQKLYILTFLPISKSSTGGGGGLFGGGGSAEPQTYNEKVFTIDIETGKCAEQVTLGTKPVPRMGYSAALYENQIFLFGGSVNYPHSPKINYNFEDLWTLDLDTFTWKELPFQVSPSARSSAAVCSVEDKIYIFGGSTQDSVGRPKKNSELYLYDIRRNTWQHIQTNSQGLEDSRMYLHDLIFHKDKLFICNNMRIHFLQIDKLSQNGVKKQSCKASDTSSQNSRQRIIFTERPFPDITFKVEQKEIPAHKAILYSGSTFFRNMFTSGMEESNKNVIEIPNMKSSAFGAVLEYIYCGTVEINDDIAWEVLQEADKYALPGLKTICEDFLASCITVESVVQTINMSEKYEANSLRTAALKYVAKNVDKVFEEADIHQIKKSTLLEIYKLKP